MLFMFYVSLLYTCLSENSSDELMLSNSHVGGRAGRAGGAGRGGAGREREREREERERERERE